MYFILFSPLGKLADRAIFLPSVVSSSLFLARDVISLLCYDVSVRPSVRLSVTEVHWRIIVNLGFKFRSKFTTHCGREEG